MSSMMDPFDEALLNALVYRQKISKRDSEPELEIEPSKVIAVIKKCSSFDNEINLISEAYHLAYGGSKDSLDNEVHLTEIETPMRNSVLHIAAWNGNDDIVTLLIERSPILLHKFNKNNDTALHVAARGGNISTVKKLLEGFINIRMQELKNDGKYTDEALITFALMKNNQGNSMLHEAMLCDKSNIGGDMIFKVCELFITKDLNCYEYAIANLNNARKTVLYLAVENGNKDAVRVILKRCPKNDFDEIQGLSSLVAAIMMQNYEMLEIILKHKPSWIHSHDTHARLPLHYAASIGYLEGVDLLLGLCKCCTIQTDGNGYFPIHLASYGGHVEVVKKLLEYCPDPTEMLDTMHERNILHIAAKQGKHEVVCLLLQNDQIRKFDKKHKLINQKDISGNTPLHLAAKSVHPKTVFY